MWRWLEVYVARFFGSSCIVLSVLGILVIILVSIAIYRAGLLRHDSSAAVGCSSFVFLLAIVTFIDALFRLGCYAFYYGPSIVLGRNLGDSTHFGSVSHHVTQLMFASWEMGALVGLLIAIDRTYVVKRMLIDKVYNFATESRTIRSFGITFVLIAFPSMAAIHYAVSWSTFPSSNPIVQGANFSVKGTLLPVKESASPLLPIQATYAEVFYGVPYAQPAVGPLRLEKPLPVKPYSQLLDCSSPNNYHPCHMQHLIKTITYSEDCLKMTIMRPRGGKKGDRLPVLVYIHPGAFVAGSAVYEGPPYNTGFLNFYVAKRILVVQIQYRLALLGFGSDGTEHLPGNLGLFDQQLAIQWVHSNIAEFGGDPAQITLFGTSAGATSVGYHTINPHSNHYFQRAIQMSGSYNAPWGAPTETSVPWTLEVARMVGCGVMPENATELKACLQQVRVEALLDATSSIRSAKEDFTFNHWTPRFDNDFITSDFASMVAAAPAKPNMAGFSSDESLPWLMHFPDSQFDIATNWTVPGVVPSDFHNFSREDLVIFIADNIVLSTADSSSEEEEEDDQIVGIRQALLDFYAPDEKVANASSNQSSLLGPPAPYFYFQQYTRLLSDIEFIVPTLWEARLKAQHGWPTYLYHFDHANEQLAAKLPYPGAVHHSAEYPYDVGPKFFGAFTFDADDYVVQRELLVSIISFVTTGVPSESWPQMQVSPPEGPQRGSTPRCTNALVDYIARIIRVDSHVESGPSGAEVAKRLAFWDELSQRYDLSRVRGFPNTQGQCMPSVEAVGEEVKEAVKKKKNRDKKI